MAVSAADVRQVADLARLRVDETAVPVLVEQLNGILQHMVVLQQVEGAGAEDAAPEGAMPLRDPSAIAIPLMHDRETFAPAMREGFFLVPRLATHEGQGAAADA